MMHAFTVQDAQLLQR